MLRPLRLLAALAPAFVALTAHAADRPDFNAYATSTPVVVPPGVAALAPARVASFDVRRGIPTMLFAQGDARLAAPGVTTDVAARTHLARYAGHYGLSRQALATAKVVRVHDTGRGGIVVTFRQEIDGVELFHHDAKLMLDRAKNLVAIGGNLHAAGGAKPKGKGFKLDDRSAIAIAYLDLTGARPAASDFLDKGDAEGGYHRWTFAKALGGEKLERPVRAKRVYFALPDRLVPAYYVEVFTKSVATRDLSAHSFVIAADDGKVLYRENLQHNDVFQYRVYASPTGDLRPTDGPLQDFTPYPGNGPTGVYPGFAAPSLVSMEGFNKNPNGQADPWLPAGATESTGNNVDAYTDDDSPDGFSAGDIRATVTAPGVFDRTYDNSQGPQVNDTQRMASITDLFYVTNWMHDHWYDSGFDEAAGNAQTDNFGRGGVAGDPLQAQAQDGAPQKRDNSNMNVPADGSPPTMQMFVWDGKDDRSLTTTPQGGNYQTAGADFGPGTFDVTALLALVNDGTGTITDGCEPPQNVVVGQILLVDRGNCDFQVKGNIAEAAGAVGLIVADNQVEPPFQMAGDGGPAVNIPAFMISQADGAALKTALGGAPVTATMHRVPGVDHDGTLDNTVIAHEWGHYLHLRQVACGNPQCGGMSEGWGDFNALMMVLRQGDNLHGIYPLAQYATVADPDDPGYFGIRRYPYSVDMSLSPLTFKYIADGEMLPGGVPVSQLAAASPNSEVHSIGEIWAAMLWEAYVSLQERATGTNPPYDFAGAHRRMTDYVEAGLQLAPVDPTITEQRDAVLAAAEAADVDDFIAMTKAFARRGAGTCAVSPDRYSQDMVGVMEDFAVAPNAAITSVTVDDSGKDNTCDDDGYVDVGEKGHVVVKVQNDGAAKLTGAKVKVSSSSAKATFPMGAMLPVPDLDPFAIATLTFEMTLADNLDQTIAFDVTAELDASQACNPKSTTTVGVRGNVDEKPFSTTTDDVEARATEWKPTGNGGKQVWTRQDVGKGDHAWVGIDFPSPSDTHLESPKLQVAASGHLKMSFDHRYTFEQSMGTNWDGGVLEFSEDGGASWLDVSTIVDPGYGGVIGDPMANNPLVGKNGFVGKNAGWPMRDHVDVDLGTSLQGKTIQVRFRAGSDDAQGAYGWEIDNIGFDGITNKPFTALVPDAHDCTQQGTGGGGNGSGGGNGNGGAGTGGGSGGSGPESGGCGCELPGGDGSRGAAAGTALLLALAAFRRRRRPS